MLLWRSKGGRDSQRHRRSSCWALHNCCRVSSARCNLIWQHHFLLIEIKREMKGEWNDGNNRFWYVLCCRKYLLPLNDSFHAEDDDTCCRSALVLLELPVFFSKLSSSDERPALCNPQLHIVIIKARHARLIHVHLLPTCSAPLCSLITLSHSSLLQSYMKWLQTDLGHAEVALYWLPVC